MSDCEELLGNLIEYLGRNESNYFMYNGWACALLPYFVILLERQSL